MHHMAPRRRPPRRPHRATVALLVSLILLVAVLIGLVLHATTAGAASSDCARPRVPIAALSASGHRTSLP